MPTSPTIRIAVVLIPADPYFSAIIKASGAITERYHNSNIIDAKRFPPHASLHICTVPSSGIDTLWDEILSLSQAASDLPSLEPTKVDKGTSGYISLGVSVTPGIMQLHEGVIEAAARVRGKDYDEWPRWLFNSSSEDQDNFDKYGSTYVRDSFDLHFSIAKVDQQDQPAALQMASGALGKLGMIATESLQICDIGMRSEKWDVLKST